MRAELRADGLHISGYVNVPGLISRPIMTSRGKMVEVIEQGAFQRAIDAAVDGVKMLLDHNPSRLLASTSDSTLSVHEDEIGLRAEALVTDPEVIEGARAGRLRGWSFNMRNVKDEVEERAEELPLRHVKAFDMDEITLAMNKVPVYSATSVEIRAEEAEDVEERASVEAVELVLPPEEPEDPIAEYKKRLEKIRKDQEVTKC